MRKMMLVTWECGHGCADEYTEEFVRQPIEHLLQPYCLDCRQAMAVKQVVNFTEKYRSRAVRVASFRDDE